MLRWAKRANWEIFVDSKPKKRYIEPNCMYPEWVYIYCFLALCLTGKCLITVLISRFWYGYE